MKLRHHLTFITSLLRRAEEARPHRHSTIPYICIEEFILKNGRAFKPKPLPDGIRKDGMDGCYKNALMLALDNPKLTYVEGVACPKESMLPAHHAWCVDAKGNVIDPTWPESAQYFGVPFRRRFVLKTVNATGHLGVIRNWKRRSPLLAKKVRGFREERFFK